MVTHSYSWGLTLAVSWQSSFLVKLRLNQENSAKKVCVLSPVRLSLGFPFSLPVFESRDLSPILYSRQTIKAILTNFNLFLSMFTRTAQCCQIHSAMECKHGSLNTPPKTAFSGKSFLHLKSALDMCTSLFLAIYLWKKVHSAGFWKQTPPVFLTESLSTFSAHLSNKLVPGCYLCADPTINLGDIKITSKNVAHWPRVWHPWSKTWLEHSRNSQSTRHS